MIYGLDIIYVNVVIRVPNTDLNKLSVDILFN